MDEYHVLYTVLHIPLSINPLCSTVHLVQNLRTALFREQQSKFHLLTVRLSFSGIGISPSHVITFFHLHPDQLSVCASIIPSFILSDTSFLHVCLQQSFTVPTHSYSVFHFSSLSTLSNMTSCLSNFSAIQYVDQKSPSFEYQF